MHHIEITCIYSDELSSNNETNCAIDHAGHYRVSVMIETKHIAHREEEDEEEEEEERKKGNCLLSCVDRFGHHYRSVRTCQGSLGFNEQTHRSPWLISATHRPFRLFYCHIKQHSPVQSGFCWPKIYRPHRDPTGRHAGRSRGWSRNTSYIAEHWPNVRQ